MIRKKRYHSRPVLSLAVDDRHMISASEDKTVCVFDRRADKVLKTLTVISNFNGNFPFFNFLSFLTIKCFFFQFEYFPLSMSYGQNQLWIGDKMGNLHLVDATNGCFDLLDVKFKTCSFANLHTR